MQSITLRSAQNEAEALPTTQGNVEAYASIILRSFKAAVGHAENGRYGSAMDFFCAALDAARQLMDYVSQLPDGIAPSVFVYYDGNRCNAKELAEAMLYECEEAAKECERQWKDLDADPKMRELFRE